MVRLVEWLRARVLAGGKLSPADLDIFHVCDDPAEAMAHIADVLRRRAPGRDNGSRFPVGE